MQAPDAISFGTFRVQPAQQVLFSGKRRIEIGSRALDLLIALVERAGELVTKDELVARAWPDTVVDESNLRAQVAALRKVLGDGRRGARYVVTVPGRGYRFVQPVERSALVETPSTPAAARPSNLPARLTRLVGRDELVLGIVGRLQRRRFVTIVGPGGIGKTSVALAAAHHVADSYSDGVCFVDLAPVADPRLVPGALATALGLTAYGDDPTPTAIAHLAEKQMLLVLDSCEHVVEAAAVLAASVLGSARGLHLIATSREPLRAEGECVHRLEPLETPPASRDLTAAEALAYSAVELFVERVAACLGDFELSDADAPIVAEICHKMDGIALAIELVAGRVDAFGIRGVAARLVDRMRLLTHGRRTALPRHRTLGAVLDWSWDYLSDLERMVLRRLAVFAGSFLMGSASAVAAEGTLTREDVPDLVADLVTKSLIAADPSEDPITYRLLDTTRAYALAKLVESGELAHVSRRHSENYRETLVWSSNDDVVSSAEPGRLDNLRAAITWSLSGGGDLDLGVALTIAAVPFWVQRSAMEECRTRVERALASLDPSCTGAAAHSIALSVVYAAALMKTGASADRIESAWARALAFAEQLPDCDLQVRKLWARCSASLTIADYKAAWAIANRLRGVAEDRDEMTTRAVVTRPPSDARIPASDLHCRPQREERLPACSDPVRAALARVEIDQGTLVRGALGALYRARGH